MTDHAIENLPPDLRKIFADLRKRVYELERRLLPRAESKDTLWVVEDGAVHLAKPSPATMTASDSGGSTSIGMNEGYAVVASNRVPGGGGVGQVVVDGDNSEVTVFGTTRIQLVGGFIEMLGTIHTDQVFTSIGPASDTNVAVIPIHDASGTFVGYIEVH